MIETARDLRGDFRFGERFREIEQEIVVIEHGLTLLRLDITSEQAAQGFVVRGRPGKVFAERLRERRLRIDDARIDREARRLGREPVGPIREPRRVPRPVHQVAGILAIVDRELRIEPEP